MKKAFTLIELLVVIAIIAILAAILFPVFAQAKAAAKATASLSNAKQNDLAIIMYEGDVDDTFPLAQTNGTTTGSYQIPGLAEQVTPWTKMIQPYSKNVDLFRDPLGPQLSAIAPFTVTDSVLIAPEYGFNFAYLNGVSATGFTGMPATTPANPANTVLITSKAGFSETTGFQKITPAAGWDAATSYLSFPPAGSGYGVTYNWGKGGFFDGAINNGAAGRYSGGNSARQADNVVVAYCDGHVKRLKVDALGAGSLYHYDSTGASVSLTSQVIAPLPTDVDPTNFGKYLWDVQ